MIVKSPRSNAQDSKQRPRFQTDVLKELRESHRSVEETEMCLKAIDLIWQYVDGVRNFMGLYDAQDCLWSVLPKSGLAILMEAGEKIRKANLANALMRGMAGDNPTKKDS